MRTHQGQVQHVLGSGQSLAASGHPEAPRILEQCQKLEGRWAELERMWEAQAQCLQQAVALQQVGHGEPPGSLHEGGLQEPGLSEGAGQLTEPQPRSWQVPNRHRILSAQAAGKPSAMSPRVSGGSQLTSSG